MRFKDLISAEGHCISFNLWRVKSFAFTVQKTISNTKVGENDDVHSLKQLIFSHAYNPMHRYLYEEVKLGCTFRWNSITTNKHLFEAGNEQISHICSLFLTFQQTQ